MNHRLSAILACGIVLLLGACSSNNASGTTTGSGSGTNPAPDTGGGGNGSSDGGEPTAEQAELKAASDAYAEAETAVGAATTAISAADAADTPAARQAAADAIADARKALDDARDAANAAVAAAEDGSDAAYGMAVNAQARANRYRTAQLAILESALSSYSWYNRQLARFTLANGEVETPRQRTNTATIKRTPRTIDTSATDSAQKVNPDAFDGDTFKDIMYSDGDRAFSASGDEFKVDGYVGHVQSNYNLSTTTFTGLKLTDAGLVIRTGAAGSTNIRYDDFTDFRRDITKHGDDLDDDLIVDDPPLGQNRWDLEITFDEPRTRSVASGETSWTGNGDFYWRAVVPADPSQTSENGEYYVENAFMQPENFRDLGTYEVWLSNHIGVDKGLEPDPGSAAPPRPEDDVQRHLKYAAYGLFVYSPDLETFRGSGSTGRRFNGQHGRVNTIHFGYEAFADSGGKRTSDIGEAITNGKFTGYTLAYETLGAYAASGLATKLLRGDATLTVNIPKGSGTATLQGTLDNFQEWSDEHEYWTAYTANFSVALGSTNIGADGAFEGTATPTPSSGFNSSGTGAYKGNFYGPRADGRDLEAAGSWIIGVAESGTLFTSSKNIFGSFGAKQAPGAGN